MTKPPLSVRPRFTLLGPMRGWRGAVELDLGPRQQRLVLALLLVRADTLVETAQLKRVVWGGRQPATADNMVHRYIGSLRHLLEPELTARGNGRYLIREPGGYRLALDGSVELDLATARSGLEAARQLVRAGRDHEAVTAYLAALDRWRGQCTAGLHAAEAPEFMAVDREGVEAIREATRVALRCGRASQLLPMLRATALRYPLDEALQADLLLALSVDGKQAEAVQLFGEVRKRLAEDLGVGPGSELRAAYESLLRQDDLASARGVAATVVSPAQLPPTLRSFTGRGPLLKEAAGLLRGKQLSPPVIAFDGMPGVGKSVLAVRLAHQVAAHFPDGQLFADLHGVGDGGGSSDPAEVLREFLGALGVSPGAVPDSLGARATLFRSIVAGRRILVVLDGARDADQVRPLLPGTAGNAVVITSRKRLAGLAATHGAHLLRLDALSMADARASSPTRVVSLRQVPAENSVSQEITELCGGLPVALAAVAARLPPFGGASLSEVAAELREAADRLDALAGGHASACATTDVTRALDGRWACARLAAPADCRGWDRPDCGGVALLRPARSAARPL